MGCGVSPDCSGRGVADLADHRAHTQPRSGRSRRELAGVGRQGSVAPAAGLNRVVFVTGVKLIDWRHLKEIYGPRRDELWIAAVTAAVVVRRAASGRSQVTNLTIASAIRARPRTTIGQKVTARWCRRACCCADANNLTTRSPASTKNEIGNQTRTVATPV